MVAEDRLHETDAFTIRMERDAQLRSTIVAVAVLDRAPDWAVLADRIDRATRLVPTFRARLVPSPFGLAPPRWVPDPDFDLSWHLRRVESPPHHSVDTVLAIGQLAATASFDPVRPLWEFTLFEGLADGQAALVMKVHHALTDGIGGIELAAHVVDPTREPQHLGPVPDPPTPRTAPGGRLQEAIGGALARPTRIARSMAGAPVGVARSVRHPARTATSVATTLTSIARFVRPMTTTLSPLMTQRSVRRHFERLDVPLADLKGTARAAGASMNDVFLASLLGGLRHYHMHHDAMVPTLRVTLPISTRRPDDPVGGNRITLIRLEVPLSVTDPVERMAVLGQIVRQARREPALGHSEAIAGMFNLLPPSITGEMLKHVDVTATNVPGFPASVYVGGARVDAFYPFAPTIGAAANVALLSYAGTANIGISTDGAAVADPEVFTRCLADGFAEVLAART